jgi:hypothetical protein
MNIARGKWLLRLLYEKTILEIEEHGEHFPLHISLHLILWWSRIYISMHQSQGVVCLCGLVNFTI